MEIDLSTMTLNVDTFKVDLIRTDYDAQDYKTSRFLFFFKTKHYPQVLSSLTFKGVNSYNITEDQEIVIYTLNDFNINDKFLTLNFNERTKLHIEFKSEINLELADIKTIETNKYKKKRPTTASNIT